MTKYFHLLLWVNSPTYCCLSSIIWRITGILRVFVPLVYIMYLICSASLNNVSTSLFSSSPFIAIPIYVFVFFTKSSFCLINLRVYTDKPVFFASSSNLSLFSLLSTTGFESICIDSSEVGFDTTDWDWGGETSFMGYSRADLTKFAETEDVSRNC